MKLASSHASLPSFAEKCKNVLASSWQAQLSKQRMYSWDTADVECMLNKREPYIWINANEMHRMKKITDKWDLLSFLRPASAKHCLLSILNPAASLLQSLYKCPVQAEMWGDAVPLKGKEAQLAMESVKEAMESEHRAMKRFHEVCGVLACSNQATSSRSETLKKLLDGGEKYHAYRFKVSHIDFVHINGSFGAAKVEDVEICKPDPLAPISGWLIDIINQSETRRSALIHLCSKYTNSIPTDVHLISVDCKGFNVLGKDSNGLVHLRFPFNKEAYDAESFCARFLEIEEEPPHLKFMPKYELLAPC